MEDISMVNSIKNFIKKYKWIIIGLILLLVLFFGYRFIMIKTNTDKFYKCVYSLNIPLDSDMHGRSGNGKIVYNTSIPKYLLEKNTSKEESETYINTILYYNVNNNTVDSSLSERSNKGLYTIYGNYNINTKKYKCTIIQDNSSSSKCNDLKKESEVFSKEINRIIKSCNINSKYVKFKKSSKK